MLKKRSEGADDNTKEENLESDKPKKYSLKAYIIIMFTVMILLILLSYFIQQRNSETIDSLNQQHSEFSISALENIERLQTENEQLKKTVDEQTDELSDKNDEIDKLEGELADVRQEWSDDVKSVEDTMKADYNGLKLKYDSLTALVMMQQAVNDGDYEKAAEYMALIQEEDLDEDALDIFGKLKSKIN
jgi:predicted nuclease with TOPRIM domain